MKLYSVEAQWHMELKDKKSGKVYAHRVKVFVLDADLGFYINGMVVYPPDNENLEWRVYTPKVGKARIIEFNGKESKLWPEIKEVCIDAVKEYLRTEKLDTVMDEAPFDLSTEEFNKQYKKALDEIPF